MVNSDHDKKYSSFNYITFNKNHISDVIVSLLAWSAVERMFESWSSQTKDCKIDICITSVSFINGSEMMIAQCQMSNISAILWPEQVTSNEMMSVLY
jgi:hypothetical protein